MEDLNYIPGFREELLQEPYVQYLHVVIHKLTQRADIQEKKIEELTFQVRKIKKLPQAPKFTASKLDKNPSEKTQKSKRMRQTS